MGYLIRPIEYCPTVTYFNQAVYKIIHSYIGFGYCITGETVVS